ncbi:hypothetical protein ILYODFUR_033204 [Ilyodon furcidens]|uniref:Uncharacterized protein n=1 Tax=Ilyodon furcidens TaxID=33524 RepID=A0ABV0T2E6_9TELE
MSRPVEDVLHVGCRIHQIRGFVPIPVLGGQTRQVCQVIDVCIGESREAKSVDVADGHGGEDHLWGCLLIQSRHMRVFQVGYGTLGRLVQKECQRSQEGKSPESLPDTQTARNEDVVDPMERAGVSKPCQVFGRWRAALLDQTLLIPILLGFLLLILLCKFDFANKFDRHVGSQVCVFFFFCFFLMAAFSPGSLPSYFPGFCPQSGIELQKEEGGKKDGREFVAAAVAAAACAVTDSAAAAASAATAPCDYSAAAVLLLLL